MTREIRHTFSSRGQRVYDWSQSFDEVHVYFPLPNVGRIATKDAFQVSIKTDLVSVGLRGNPPYLAASPAGKLISSESFWLIEDSEMHVVMTKASPGQVWSSCFAGHVELDPMSEEKAKQSMLLERMGSENPGFDFSEATFSGSAPDPRSFMRGL